MWLSSHTLFARSLLFPTLKDDYFVPSHSPNFLLPIFISVNNHAFFFTEEVEANKTVSSDSHHDIHLPIFPPVTLINCAKCNGQALVLLLPDINSLFTHLSIPFSWKCFLNSQDPQTLGCLLLLPATP